MKIDCITLRIIPDSRGDDTLEAEFRLEDLMVRASVPSGKSRGTHEAFVLSPKTALSKFETIKEKILHNEFEKQIDFDDFLIREDGTSDKSNLGGNLILALSLAWARLKSKIERTELYEYIRSVYNPELKTYNLPWPVFNMIEGGAHTRPWGSKKIKSNVDFQEFQIIYLENDFKRALEVGKEFYGKLKLFLEEKYGADNVGLGDEAGFSAPFQSNEEALQILSELIESRHNLLRIGLDVAASQFYKKQTTDNKQQNFYLVGGRKYFAEELQNFYLELVLRYNLLSIEDPFDEESFDDFSKLSGAVASRDLKIITDDLTTTNPERLKTAVAQKAGNAILIKPNQIGTLSETIEVAKIADSAGWSKIASHRSGETIDDFISDLAVGIGAWGIKVGAPAKPERLVKCERLLAINSLKSAT